MATSPSVEGAKRIQDRLKIRVELANRFGSLQTVGGLDISYNRFSQKAAGALTVFRLSDLSPIETVTAVRKMEFPYVPGYLAFREGPVLLSAFEKINREPDVLLFDGHGIAHPNRFGIACHMGVLLDIPSIGCAKSPLVGEFQMPGESRGSRENLRHEGETVGVVYRSRTGVKPIFISPGHRIDLETSLEIVAQCIGKHRIPVPTREAHAAANETRRSELTPPRESRRP